MTKLHFAIILAAITALTACGGSQNEQPQQAAPPIPKANLPISADAWTQWQCPNGDTLRTRYSDHNGNELKLEHSSGKYRLNREPSRNPAIYSDGRIGFYSDGKHAAIGRAMSDEIISGGCTAQ